MRGLGKQMGQRDLPGIAGFVLSIGMAVDANVLIFERISEELDRGKAVATAIDDGFRHAIPAIVDSNVSTVLTEDSCVRNEPAILSLPSRYMMYLTESFGIRLADPRIDISGCSYNAARWHSME